MLNRHRLIFNRKHTKSPSNHVMQKPPPILLLADAILSKVLVRKIRDVGLGDLWESHLTLRKKGTNKVLTNIITIWRSCLLIKASVQIYYDDRDERRKQQYLFPTYVYPPYLFGNGRHKHTNRFLFSLIFHGVTIHVATSLASTVFHKMPSPLQIKENETAARTLPFSIEKQTNFFSS